VSKRITCIGLLLACAFTIKAQANLVLNGSFELNNALGCWTGFANNIDYNNTVSYSNHFGDDYTTAIFNLPCLVCSPPFLWGGQPKDGNWVLVLVAQDETIVLPPPTGTIHIIKQGKISLALDAPLLNTKRYKLSFWIKAPPTNIPSIFCIDDKNNYIEVGISNYEDSLGRNLITTNLGDTEWQKYTWVFETQNAEEYLTIKAGLNGVINYFLLLDNFTLVETEEPLTTGVNEVAQQEKQLVKIVDILGKESSPNKKGLLFYIYSDGTVEKKLVIE
jgi:hypothetical protein